MDISIKSKLWYALGQQTNLVNSVLISWYTKVVNILGLEIRILVKIGSFVWDSIFAL